VLGDRFGSSCLPALTDRAAASLHALGYTVCRNKPYAGASSRSIMAGPHEICMRCRSR
jgi:N-formylglutamate amidohydrolase